MKVCLIVLFAAIIGVLEVSGHGMVMNPVNRGSIWRLYGTGAADPDYNDNGNFCGGFYVQHSINGGKCGLCGNDFRDPMPRAHENGGKYGKGFVVANYPRGATIPVSVQITANHLGYFYLNLCNLDTYGRESEACFAAYSLKTSSGSTKYYLNSAAVGYYNFTVTLPAGVSCKRCVLQWTYTTGNNWGYCDDGSGKLGCGDQENFRTCSDISIS
uniref:Putative chitin binding domain protein n=1 Tax=Nyssomyia neivai TaxID=330878 RepID=A0A1L8E399_9DIPT